MSELKNILEYKVITIKISTIDEKTYENFLEQYKKLKSGQNIVCMIQTYGSINFSANKIGKILMRHPGDVVAFVPKYAYSGGTLVALSCGSIILGKNAVISPCDSQIYRSSLPDKELKEFKDHIYEMDRTFFEEVVDHYKYSDVIKKKIVQYFYKPRHDTKLTYEMVKDIGININSTKNLGHRLASYFRNLERYLDLVG
ncbi:MAG: hypothetical protein Hyperionvirus36_8 [Hyperionvirus sp.]|uniref:Serine dehydrogenase proteinase n=1 Tax=Hyperionvirus sp. TaxID=2487770 RepID=A0A3G5AEN2_9VIRU|nr:MAG: hypothetical protein Hyperionvirus36_8 [Hyperionvirus sp.]